MAGVGPVCLPLRAPQVKKLIAVARPALFGRREDTLSDSSVRDTWQIPPDQVTLDGPAWPTLLDGALEYFRDELGLPASTRLRAEPHALLVYGKGQFFLPHQDSEKDDAMVGTLVLSLPSAHTGGELVIGHAGQSRTYRASKTELSLVAFYADCPHEVTPVRSGYRVTLTFNLLAERGAPEREAGPLDDMAHCLEQHFDAPARPRYRGRDLDPWPRERAFAARGEAGSRWALEELQARITKGDRDGARAAAESLAPLWRGSGVQPGQLGTALRVAEGLQAPGTATMLLEPFRIDALTPEYADDLAAVAKRYGVQWLGQVTEGWFGGAQNRFEEHRHDWTERLPQLCAALRPPGVRRWRNCC